MDPIENCDFSKAEAARIRAVAAEYGIDAVRLISPALRIAMLGDRISLNALRTEARSITKIYA